jgi:uncharacterized protein YecE (DUF72 family)
VGRAGRGVGHRKEPADAEGILDHPAHKKQARDVYLYFDNDAKVRAPVDAKNRRHRAPLASRVLPRVKR